MKTELALIALLTLAGTALFFQQGETTFNSPQDPIYKAYAEWKAQYGQNINSSEEEYRFATFKQNYLFVEEHNASSTDIQLKMTEFAAMTNEEYQSTKLTTILEKKNIEESDISTLSTTGLPSQVNWVDAGAVTPVQNQGNCGSCWAFSTVAGLESLHYNLTGDLQKYSEQQVVSCVPYPFSLGCGGGNTIFGYTYTSIAGIETESEYPYSNGNTKVTASCDYDKAEAVVENSGVKIVEANDPNALQAAVAQQVVSVSVDASSIYFQLYSHGVLSNNKCGDSLNHAIAAVGYNMDAEAPYWIVKNSWGTGWGQQGYIWIKVTEGNGVCGINMDNTYPTM